MENADWQSHENSLLVKIETPFSLQRKKKKKSQIPVFLHL